MQLYKSSLAGSGSRKGWALRYPGALLLLFLAVSACSTRQYTADDLSEERLIFGHGGGFAGSLEEYVLLRNGQLFARKEWGAELEEWGRLEPATARRQFRQLKKTDFDDIRYDRPGNMYYFIRYQRSDYTHQVQWSAAQGPPEKELKQLYQQLMDLAEKARSRYLPQK